MGMSLPDQKRLWALSGGKCAKCRRDVLRDSKDRVQVGDEAHISGDKPSAARFDSTLTDEDRDGYANRMILCKSCHKIVDDNPAQYSISKLHAMKTVLEQEVAVCRSMDERRAIAHVQMVCELADYIQKQCRFHSWNEISRMASEAKPYWPLPVFNDMLEAVERILRSNFVDQSCEVSRSIQSFGEALHRAIDTFDQHCEQLSQFDRLNANHPFLTENDESRRPEYNKWVNACTCWMYFTTACGNWFIDAVQRKVAPEYRLSSGKLAMMFGGQIESKYCIPELSHSEKESLPGEIERVFNERFPECNN